MALTWPPPKISLGTVSRTPCLLSYVRSSDRSGVFGELFEASAHARIAEMEPSGVRPCRENSNYLKWVAN